MSKLFLIDGHSQVFQAYYALGSLTSPDGLPVNAIFGFVGMLQRLLREYKPDYCAVVFDMEGPTFRHEAFKEYKATRKPTPEDLVPQIPVIREIIEAYQLPSYGVRGYEADDVIATIAKKVAEKGLDVFIVTTDKDAQQLIGPHISVLNARKDQVLDLEWLKKERGLTPEQVVDVMALEGDAVDNVPGVPGVGEKTALQLIHEYGTLENVLQNADRVKRPKLRENLRNHADSARLSKRLVTLDSNVPVEFSLDEMKIKGPDRPRLIALFKGLDFKKFLAELTPAPASDPPGAAPTAVAQKPPKTEYRLVNTPEALDALLNGLRKQDRFALDTETTGLAPMDAELAGMSFAWTAGEAYYVPFMGPLGALTLNRQKTLAAFAPFLQDAAVAKIGQNIKYDMLVLRNHGITVRGVFFDTMIAAYLLDPDRKSYSLENLGAELVGVRKTPISDLIGEGRRQVTIDTVPLDKVCPYACADADITLRLANVLEPRLREMNLWSLFQDVEVPLIEVLADMEHAGVALDKKLLQTMSETLAKDMAALEERIYEAAGGRFNIASPKQLAAILFEKLKLAPVSFRKTGPSTDADVLQELAHQHELPGLVIKYREYAKLKSTYVDTLPKMVNARSGRIHCSFNQTGAATGRLSSSDPNLQNIPARTELGRRIRAAFVPSGPDRSLLTADYSQIELRILAHVTGDPALRQAFDEDKDIHLFVASQIYGVPAPDVTKQMRSHAKAVSFGIIYGQTPFGLSRTQGIPVETAREFIDAYFARYPKVKDFITRTIREATAVGYVTTLMNRRRYMPGLQLPDRTKRALYERMAVNAVIQGSAADMIKVAMIRIRRALEKGGEQARLLLQIHDELLLEVPDTGISAVRETVVREMVSALPLSVPVKVNSAVGKNWLEVA